MPLTLSQLPFGPFVKGVVDGANPSLDLTGAVRSATGVMYQGVQRLLTRPGTSVALTLLDDQVSPANVTSVCAVVPFADRALAVAHSTVTNKAYLYVLKASMDDWYNAAGALQGTTSPKPVGTLWSAITVAPDVTIAEGLGVAYIAHAQAQDSAGLYFATRTWDGTTLADFAADLDGGGSKSIYALWVAPYHQHLFFGGFGSGNVAGATAYRPELLRFSTPNFGTPQASDSFTVGVRVRSDREHTLVAGLAGDALIVQGAYLTTRVTGYGRASWMREIVDAQYGITGPKAGVSDKGYWYCWTHRGPARFAQTGPIEPLWDAIPLLVASVVNPEKIVATADPDRDQVVFTVDTGTGVRTRVSYDTRRNVWLGPSDDWGLVIRAGGIVDPVLSSTASGVGAPIGPPTTASTTAVGATTATAHWVAGDVSASTQVSHRVQGTTTWTVDTTVGSGITSYTITGLTLAVAYEWRCAHVKGGQFSTYLGPSAATQFTTNNQLQPPTNLGLSEVSVSLITVTWTNSGESGVSTEIYVQSPGTVGYALKETATPGYASAQVGVDAGAGVYQVEIRHVKSGYTASVYDGPNSITLT